jgi:hypothetical protein
MLRGEFEKVGEALVDIPDFQVLLNEGIVRGANESLDLIRRKDIMNSKETVF